MGYGIVGSPPSKTKETYEPLGSYQECFLEHMNLLACGLLVGQGKCIGLTALEVLTPHSIRSHLILLASWWRSFSTHGTGPGRRSLRLVVFFLHFCVGTNLLRVKVTEYLGPGHILDWTDVGVLVWLVIVHSHGLRRRMHIHHRFVC